MTGGGWATARKGIADFLHQLRVRPVVEFDDAGRPRFSFSAALAPADADIVIADVFSLLAARRDRSAVLILDEFQAITRHGEHLPFLLKGLSDKHSGISVVVAGSRHHLMSRLVVDEGAPLYGMAQRLALGPIPDAEWIPFLMVRGGGAGKPMSSAAAQRILELAGPVPNDVQHLAFESFEVAAAEIGMAEWMRECAVRWITTPVSSPRGSPACLPGSCGC